MTKDKNYKIRYGKKIDMKTVVKGNMVNIKAIVQEEDWGRSRNEVLGLVWMLDKNRDSEARVLYGQDKEMHSLTTLVQKRMK